MAITSETLRLVNGLRRKIDRIVDQQTRDLVIAWVDSWDEVAGDLEAAMVELVTDAGDGRVTRAQAIRSRRLRAALETIATRLDDLTQGANGRIIDDLLTVIDDAGRTAEQIITSQLPAVERDLVNAWETVSDKQLDAIVRRTTQRITSTLRPLRADTMRAIRGELVRGVASGTNPRATARRMVDRANMRWNGDLGLTRALRVARTETLDAHRAGALAARTANADIITGWMWMCELSTRSCPSCIAQHGSLHAADEPGPFDHVNGRCTATPVTKSWRELGINQSERLSAMPDARTWFDSLPHVDKVSIMGAKRLELLQSGRISWDDLSVLKHNPGWRDSYQVASLPQLTRSSVA